MIYFPKVDADIIPIKLRRLTGLGVALTLLAGACGGENTVTFDMTALTCPEGQSSQTIHISKRDLKEGNTTYIANLGLKIVNGSLTVINPGSATKISTTESPQTLVAEIHRNNGQLNADATFSVTISPQNDDSGVQANTTTSSPSYVEDVVASCNPKQ